MTELATQPTSSKPAKSQTSQATQVKAKAKAKSRARARPRRRRAVESESGSGSESDQHGSVNSDASDSEEDKSTKKPAAFADMSATTPAAWADEAVGAEADVVAFDEFNPGETSRKQTAKNGKVYTEEQTKRYEERKAKLKEKQKAKKAAVKEEKRKERERKEAEAKAVEPKKEKKGKGKQRVESEELVESTAALKLDDATEPASASASAPAPAPSPVPASEAPPTDTTVATTNPPAELTRRPPTGPRAVPGMWPHGHRPPPFDNNFGPRFMGTWRGRGDPRGAFRGGLRGRGRGGFVPPFARGGFAKLGPRRQDLPPSASPTPVDKAVEAADASEDANEVEEAKAPAPSVAVEGRWGHDGYEAMRAAEQLQANRMMMRGRGRGRGFFGGRGFHPHPPFHHDLAGPSGPHPAPIHTPRQSASIEPVVETPSTQPVADALLETDIVEVSLPPNSSTPDLKASVDTLNETEPRELPSAAAPVFVQPQPVAAIPTPAFAPAVYSDGTASPAPYGVAGSENGSVSSNGHPPFAQPFLPPGVAMGPAGDYYNLADGSPVDFRPQVNGQHRHYHYAQQYYPQSYSPDFFQPSSRNGSFSSSGGFIPDPRSASPFPVYNPYAAGPGVYYPQGTKMPGDAGGAGGGQGVGAEYKRYAPDPSQMYYAQHYNPYIGAGGYQGEGYVDYAPEYGY